MAPYLIGYIIMKEPNLEIKLMLLCSLLEKEFANSLNGLQMESK